MIQPFSYDYLVETIKLLSHGDEVRKQDIGTNHRALSSYSPLITSGVIEVNYRHIGRGARGRGPGYFRLTRPYPQICVGDISKSIPLVTRYEKVVYQQAKDIPLAELDRVIMPRFHRPYSIYSGDKLLAMLFLLSTDHYTQYNDILDKAYTGGGTSRMIADMTYIGVAENCYGLGYRLSRPLNQIFIHELLPYLCSNSVRRKQYNRLFYALKERPISHLQLTEK